MEFYLRAVKQTAPIVFVVMIKLVNRVKMLIDLTNKTSKQHYKMLVNRLCTIAIIIRLDIILVI